MIQSMNTLPIKVSREQVESVIAKVEYYNPPGTSLTLCMIHCKNGFIAVGESACVDPSQYDPKLGQEYSYEQAFEKVWSHEGYVLRTMRYERRLGTPSQRTIHPSDATSPLQMYPLTNFPGVIG